MLPRPNVLGHVQVCELSSHKIQCDGSKIYIESANYGRKIGGPTCGGPIRTHNCGAAGSLGKVRKDCQGRSSCVLQATNNKFGDPCGGTKKYLEVKPFRESKISTLSLVRWPLLTLAFNCSSTNLVVHQDNFSFPSPPPPPAKKDNIP